MEAKLNEFNKRVFTLFQTPILELSKNKFEWMVQHNIPTSCVDTWYYWEYEQFIKFLNDKNKEDNDQREKQEKGQQEKYSNFNPSSLAKQYNPANVMKNLRGSSNSAFPRL